MRVIIETDYVSRVILCCRFYDREEKKIVACIQIKYYWYRLVEI